MSFLCSRSVQLTFLQFHDLFLPVLLRSDGSLRLTSLSVLGLERLVSSCLRWGKPVCSCCPAVVAAASQVCFVSGASRLSSLFCGPVSEGPVPGSSVADVPIRSQPSVLGGAAVGSPLSSEACIGPPVALRKSTGAILVRN